MPCSAATARRACWSPPATSCCGFPTPTRRGCARKWPAICAAAPAIAASCAPCGVFWLTERSAHRDQLDSRRTEFDQQSDTKKNERADRDVAQDGQQVMHRVLLDRPFSWVVGRRLTRWPAPPHLRLCISGTPTGPRRPM